MGLAILGIIVAIAIPVLNPTAQIQKGYNAKREHDFLQIRNSLDAYYNDNNKYPSSFSFGTDFTGVGGTIYMKKVPKDPSCSSTGVCSDNYIYLTNPDNPQWFVLFAKLQGQTSTAVHCPYSCTPIPTSYNFCVFGGNIDTSFCSLIVSTPTPTPPITSPTPTPTLTPSPTPTTGVTPTLTPILTPTPTIPQAIPTPVPCPGGGYYYCACGPNNITICNYAFDPPQNLDIDYQCYPNCINPSGYDTCGDPC